jgi:ribosomal protein S18 acetylase RimI-like enzyme
MRMKLRFQFDTRNIDWESVPEILEKAGIGFYPAEKHKHAFHNSHAVVFVFDSEHLIGFGRVMSDGEYQAAIYDVAILPEYQQKGIGKQIISHLMDRTPGCNYILYAAPGKEPFYEKIGFRRMKTGLALFVNREHMQQRGFTE